MFWSHVIQMTDLIVVSNNSTVLDCMVMNIRHFLSHLTFRGLCSWYILIIKANEMHYFSALFGKELYVIRTDLLSIIRSLNTVFTAIGICHTSYVYCLLARSGWNQFHPDLASRQTYCISLAFIIRIFLIPSTFGIHKSSIFQGPTKAKKSLAYFRCDNWITSHYFIVVSIR
jgi:hypothetical protein